MNPTTYLAFLVPGILLEMILVISYNLLSSKNTFQALLHPSLFCIIIFFFTAKVLITERLMTKKRLLSYFLIGFVIQAPLALIALFISKRILSLF